MAAHTGILLDSDILGTLVDSALDTTDVAEFPTDFVFLGADLLTGGAKTDVPDVAEVDNFTGILLGDFADLWYNRVHIVPNRIDVGNLTSQQVRPIEIWNGYFIDRTLSDVINNGLSGVSFDVALPLVLPPLGGVYRNLVIDTIGTPQFSGSFTLEFDDKDYFLYVTGKRVLVMPFQHNWQDRVYERLAWYNTSSGKSLDGIEQLVAWRDKPRRTLDYHFLLASTHTNAKRLKSLFAALIAGWQTRIFAVPIWTDATRLPVQADAGQNEVYLTTTAFDYDVGSFVMLWQNEETYELLEIAEVYADHLVLAVNLVNTWQAGRSVVMPARLAYINNNLRGTKHTEDIRTVPVSFELLPQYENDNRLVAGSEVTYRDLPVLLTKNNYDPTNTFALEQPVIRNDADTGIFSIDADQPAPDDTGTFGWIFRNHADIATFYKWLDDRKGRLTPFWLPTWAHDFELHQDIGSADTSITIKAINYSSMYYIDGAPAYNRRDIMILLKSGTRFFRRITAAAIAVDGLTESITISSALGQIVTVSQIDRICFLVPSALKADTVDIEWHSGNVSAVNTQIVDVYDDTI